MPGVGVRPAPVDVPQGEESWDSSNQRNVDLVFQRPLAMKRYEDVGDLPDPQEFAHCVCVVKHGPNETDWSLAVSTEDGGGIQQWIWRFVPLRSAALAALVDGTGGTSTSPNVNAIPGVSSLPVSLLTLAAELNDDVLPAIRDAYATLIAYTNTLKQTLVDGGSMEST